MPQGAHGIQHARHPSAYVSGAFPLNDAFDLSDALHNCTLPTCSSASLPVKCASSTTCGLCLRQRLHTKRYRQEPLFGVLENKVLIKPVLSRLGMPFVAPRYAALADGPVGGFARFSRSAFAEEVRWHGVRNTVFKPATDGMARNVEVYGSSRASGNDLPKDPEAIALRAAEAMQRSGGRSTRWKQEYNHRGVLLEPRYESTDGNGGLLELKMISIFGVPVCLRAIRFHNKFRTVPLTLPPMQRRTGTYGLAFEYRLPRRGCFRPDAFAPSSPRDGTTSSTSHAQSRSACDAQRAAARMALALVNRERRRLDEYGARIAYFFGSDWVRVDIFVGNEALGWRINEVTYPSAWPLPVDGMADNPCCDAWRLLVQRYQERRCDSNGCRAMRDSLGSWSLVPSKEVLAQIAVVVNVSVSYLNQSSSR